MLFHLAISVQIPLERCRFPLKWDTRHLPAISSSISTNAPFLTQRFEVKMENITTRNQFWDTNIHFSHSNVCPSSKAFRNSSSIQSALFFKRWLILSNLTTDGRFQVLQKLYNPSIKHDVTARKGNRQMICPRAFFQDGDGRRYQAEHHSTASTITEPKTWCNRILTVGDPMAQECSVRNVDQMISFDPIFVWLLLK